MRYRHVMAAVDPESPSEAILQRASRWAKMAQGRLTVAAAIPDLRTLYHGTDSQLQRDFDKSVVAAAREGLDSACRQSKISAADVIVLRGDADEAVAARAREQHADLIVFGNHDRHGLEQYVGGFGLGLLHRAHCDLLAVNPKNPWTERSAPLVALAREASDLRVIAHARASFPDQRLHVVHVRRGQRGDSIQSVQAALESVIADYAPFDLEVIAGTPSTQIDEAARHGKHGIVVMGSGQHTQLGWHLGSTAHNLLSRTTSDVLLIRPKPDASGGDS